MLIVNQIVDDHVEYTLFGIDWLTRLSLSVINKK